MASEAFAQQVSALKEELSRLQEQLRVADAAGDRRVALEILARMLKLQGSFFQRWKVSPPAAGAGEPGR